MNKVKHVNKMKYSIKRTVFLTFSSLTVLMFIFYACLSIVVAFSVEDEVIKQMLATEGNYLRAEYNGLIYKNHKQTKNIQPRIHYMTLYKSLRDVPAEFVEVIKEGGGEKEIFTDAKEHFHYRTIVLSNGATLYLIAEVSSFLVVSNMSGDILLLTFFIFFIMLIIALYFTYLISQRAIQPIVKLTNAVKEAQMTQQGNNLPYIQSKDEIGFLARSLALSFTELNNALKREADFTRDVGHELRTPLTIISNTLALSQNRELSADEKIGLHQQTDNLKNIIDVLMSLARAESVRKDKVNLRAHVEECILTMHSAHDQQGFSVILDIDDKLTIQTNPQLLTLLLLNLVENSLRYAASPELTISATATRITFENTVQKSIESQVLNRAVKQENSAGIGQGLYLVKRIVAALNWQCSIENKIKHNEIDNKTFKFILHINEDISLRNISTFSTT